MGLLHTEKDGKVIREFLPSENGNYMEFYNGIYQAFTTGAAVPVNAADGRNVITIIEKAYLSNKEKKVIAI